MVAHGEVWWYEEPDSKRRPYLVITRNEAIGVLQRVLAVPATTHTRGIASEVPLDRTDGMPAECVLSLDNLRTISKAGCTELIARLGPAKLRDVCEALAFVTDC